MPDVLTKCGYRCDLCLAYKDNIQKKDERDYLSDTWFKIYGFRIPPNQIYCEGCVSSKNPLLIDKDCPVRPCVINHNIENCAYCNEYICEKLLQRIVNRNELEIKSGNKFSELEYVKCIMPYESKVRLDEIRNKNNKDKDF